MYWTLLFIVLAQVHDIANIRVIHYWSKILFQYNILMLCKLCLGLGEPVRLTCQANPVISARFKHGGYHVHVTIHFLPKSLHWKHDKVGAYHWPVKVSAMVTSQRKSHNASHSFPLVWQTNTQMIWPKWCSEITIIPLGLNGIVRKPWFCFRHK